MTKLDIEAIRQSPRQYVDLKTVEELSDYAMLLEQQLAEREKQIVMLREALEVCSGVTGHEFKLREKALSATQDLAGLILCGAEPFAWDYTYSGRGVSLQHIPEGKPLYKARTK